MGKRYGQPTPEEPPRTRAYVPVTEAAPATVAEAERQRVEQRVAITLSVSDGFRFGCGVLLAVVACYFALLMVVAAALLVATVLNLPLPFGLGR
jgi:hypothetical protein